MSWTSLPDASSFVTLDSVSNNFQIQTANIALKGVYTVTVTATVPVETAPGSGVNISDTFSFTITVIDACETTTMSFNPIVTDMLAYVNLAADTQTVLAKDTASGSYGNLDGFTLCGSRSYSISPTSYSFLSLAGDVLSLVSTNPAEKTTSPITITISAQLDSYPTIPAVQQTFTIQILDHCDSTTLSFTPVVSNMIAYVN